MSQEKEFKEIINAAWKAYPDKYEICATEFVCSVCKESFASSELTDEQFLEMMKYCPNCGSKMKGGAE
jgi:ribosomal protein L33